MTTCSSDGEATLIASELMEKRLAACVQWSGITSMYRWKGSVETAEEVRLLIKARGADYADIEAVIQAAHSYENPEIVAVPVVAGSAMYLDWISAETAR